MADLPSRLDLFALGRAFVRSRATRLDPYQVDVEGSDANIVVGVTSQMAYFLVLQLAYSVNRLLLDGAEGEDLDRYAWDRYTLLRKGASAAVVPLRIYRATGGPSGTVPAGTKVKSATGIEYVTTSSASFGISDLTSTCNSRTTQAGKASQVGANALQQFSDPTSLFDQTLRVNNDVPAAGGEGVQPDDNFRETIRNFWATARRGTLGAIEFGAAQVDGVVSAHAEEALTTVTLVMPWDTLAGLPNQVTVVSASMPARVVNLYVADSTGVANQVLANLVRIALEDYRAAGIAVLVSVGTPRIIAIQLVLTFQADIDTVTLTDAIIGALFEYVNSLGVNDTLLRSALFTVLQRFTANGLIVNQGTIVAPTGDLVPNPGETLRTTVANITTS